MSDVSWKDEEFKAEGGIQGCLQLLYPIVSLHSWFIMVYDHPLNGQPWLSRIQRGRGTYITAKAERKAFSWDDHGFMGRMGLASTTGFWLLAHWQKAPNGW